MFNKVLLWILFGLSKLERKVSPYQQSIGYVAINCFIMLSIKHIAANLENILNYVLKHTPTSHVFPTKTKNVDLELRN